MSAGVLVNYIDRVNISHALIPMADELHLNTVEQGAVLSAFSWGYVLFMAVGGALVDRIGPARVAAAAAVIWSIATAWTGISGNLLSLIASRLAVGAGEAPIFPANARLVRDEFPLDERGRATALFDAGSYLGTALSAPIVVYSILQWGWRSSFFVCAALGLVWTIIWLTAVPRLRGPTDRDPATRVASVSGRSSFFQLLRNKKIIGASVGFFCYNYSKSFFLTWFPAFLVKERGFTLIQVGAVGMIPPLCAVAGEILAGTITDRLIRKGTSVTVARKGPLCLGMMLAASIAGAAFTTSQVMILAILSFAFASMIAASPGIWAIPGDIAPAPEYVGTIGGIQNTFSNLAGIVAPSVTGILVAMTGSFASALLLSAVLAVTGAASYWFIVGTLEPIHLEPS